MSLDDLEKLRSIRQGGKTKGKARVKHLSDRGRNRGFEIEHDDGSIEAVVRPAPIRAKFSVGGNDE